MLDCKFTWKQVISSDFHLTVDFGPKNRYRFALVDFDGIICKTRSIEMEHDSGVIITFMISNLIGEFPNFQSFSGFGSVVDYYTIIGSMVDKLVKSAKTAPNFVGNLNPWICMAESIDPSLDYDLMLSELLGDESNCIVLRSSWEYLPGRAYYSYGFIRSS